MNEQRPVTRLNAFTDAAFAFALTMLLVSGSRDASDLSAIGEIIEQIPGYLSAFAIIAVFWTAHVRWSRRDGHVDTVTITLSLALIFLVLIFVYPLRTLAQTAFELMRGDYSIMTDFTLAEAQRLFIFYGLGFTGMSAMIALLHEMTRRSGRYDPNDEYAVIDDVAIWSFIAGTGVLSVLLSMVQAIAPYATFAYWLIPIFVFGYNRTQRRRRAVAATTDEEAE